MITFFRVLYFAAMAWGFYVGITEGIVDGVLSFIAAGAMIWVLLVLVELFMRLGGFLTRPRTSQHLHVYVEPHPDPTRPDWTHEDEHPIVVLNEGQYRRRK